MLHRIGQQSDRPDGVVPRLLHCHARIRRFTALAARLGDGEPAPEAEVADAARAVLDYFERALPLHAADEDESIAPRLGPTQAAALAEMTAQHAAIDRLLGGMLPRWRKLAEVPGGRATQLADLASGAARLADLFDAHLALEETQIFPAVTQLAAEVQASILAEMTGRRDATPG